MQKSLLRCRFSLKTLFQADRTHFIFTPYFAAYLNIVKIPHFDHFKLSRFKRLWSFWKLVSLLIRTSVIRIGTQRMSQRAPDFFFNFWLADYFTKWQCLIYPSTNTKRIENPTWKLSHRTKNLQGIEWCEPQNEVLNRIGVMSR